MVTLETLNRWLVSVSEDEHLEFKEAKNQFDTTKLMRYCVALANEGGGYLVLGVSDKLPRKVVGTHAFKDANDIKSRVLSSLRVRIEFIELMHTNGRVLVIKIPSRPTGQPMHHDGSYLMRAGEELVPMTPDQLRKIFDEGHQSKFFEKIATNNLAADDIVVHLDTQTYFDLLKMPYPSSRDRVIAHLVKEALVKENGNSYAITNLGALLLAKDLRAFDTVNRKALRIVVYKGKNKLETVREQIETKGYAVGYESLVGYINSQLPANEVIGQALRTEMHVYPIIAIRELVANALVHQDFDESGMSPMVEIYSDRIEISNPGKPLIPTERFVDEYKSRNERLADFLRRMRICEEKSSGIDKVVSSTEAFQLPAPDFRVGTHHTITVLFAHQEFGVMVRADRMRACYLHCCLRYVSNEKMSNQSLRERFRLPESKAEAVSRIIADTIEAGLVKLDDPESNSRRYAKYVPFWA